jgi:hypothetical protein
MTSIRPVRRGVSKGVEDGRRPPALRADHPRGHFGCGPPAGHRKVGHGWLGWNFRVSMDTPCHTGRTSVMGRHGSDPLWHEVDSFWNKVKLLKAMPRSGRTCKEITLLINSTMNTPNTPWQGRREGVTTVTKLRGPGVKAETCVPPFCLFHSL